MSEKPRDWDRELADIDGVIAKQGSIPPGGVPSPAPGGRVSIPGVATPVRGGSVALTWFWVVLAFGFGLALAFWPYQRSCGLRLFYFLGAAGVTALIALIGAFASWSHRRGFAHLVSLLVIVWAAAVALRDVLPRVGYAKTSLPWMCEAAPPGPAPAGPAPATP